MRNVLDFCPVCNRNTSFIEKLFILNKRKNINIKNFTYYSCLRCSFLILKPDLTKIQLRKIYNNEYYPKLEKSHENKLVNMLLKIRMHPSYEAFVKKYSKGKLLDIGCGTGEFLKKMMKCGFDVYGLDPYKSAVSNTEDKIGKDRVILGNITKLLSLKKKFDIVTMWHVLEHIDTPFVDLININKKLKKDGKLFIEVPNGDSFLFSKFKQNYNWLMIPEHKHYFTNKSLRQLLINTNFHIVSQYCPPKALTNFSQSLKNFFKSRKYNKVIIDVVYLTTLPLFIIISILLSTFGKGEVIRVIAEKK